MSSLGSIKIHMPTRNRNDFCFKYVLDRTVSCISPCYSLTSPLFGSLLGFQANRCLLLSRYWLTTYLFSVQFSLCCNPKFFSKKNCILKNTQRVERNFFFLIIPWIYSPNQMQSDRSCYPHHARRERKVWDSQLASSFKSPTHLSHWA